MHSLCRACNVRGHTKENCVLVRADLAAAKATYDRYSKHGVLTKEFEENYKVAWSFYALPPEFKDKPSPINLNVVRKEQPEIVIARIKEAARIQYGATENVVMYETGPAVLSKLNQTE